MSKLTHPLDPYLSGWLTKMSPACMNHGWTHLS
jgi:hypothetical protein